MRPGTRIDGRFEIETRAGAGGMGEVYRAVDLECGHRVAVKVLLGSSPHERRRFAREIAIVANLHHEAIAGYRAHGQLGDGRTYLVIEWLSGPSLRDRLRRSALELDETLRLGERLADALGAAHAAGIVHRDVKPANILLPEDDVAKAKLVDFGVARAAAMGEDTLTETGALVGTFRYMAPEQARDAKKVDGRADIYALGAVLFECLAGAPAIQEAEPANVLAKILLEPPPHIRVSRPSVTPSVDDLLVRMMAKVPADRPTTAWAARELIRTARAGTLDPSEAHAGISESERRLVWVMLASDAAQSELPTRVMSASAAPLRAAQDGESQDPQPSRVAAATADSVESVVESNGGRLEILADGTALVAFTGEGENSELERAAATAFEWRSLSPKARIVLAAGPGVHRSERAAERPLQIGDVIDQATAVLREAAPGTIQLTAGAKALLERRFLVVGKELRGLRSDDQTVHPVLGRVHPTLGRNRELASLRALLDECVEDEVAKVVLLEGPAGIGKSRIVRELVAGARQAGTATVLRGCAPALQQGAPFALLVDLLRAVADIHDDDDPRIQRGKVERCLLRNVPSARRPRVGAFLSEILSIPEGDGGLVEAARHDPSLMHDAVCESLEDFFAAQASVGPLVAILDDVHWADRPSLELLRTVVRQLRDRALMVVLVGRPEMRHRLDQAWPKLDADVVALAPLSRKASESLARSILGEQSPATVEIAGRSGGNPLFIEELARAAADRSDVLSDNVLAAVQARLDELDAQARLLLRAASLFGRRFWSGGVESVAGGTDQGLDVRRRLAELEHREVVVRSRRSSLGEEPEYEFVHDLVRDGAYAMLTAQDRERGHALAGRWLVRAGARDAEMLATHFELGGLREDAMPWLMRAAQQALDANDLERAVARADGALAAGADVVPMAILKAQALNAAGRGREALPSGRRAYDAANAGERLWFRAAIEVATSCAQGDSFDEIECVCRDVRSAPVTVEAVADKVSAMAMVAWLLQQSGRVDLACELVEEAESVADANHITDPLPRAHLAGVRATRAYGSGDVAAYLRESERAADFYAAAGHRRYSCGQALNVAVGYIGVGCYERAREVIEGILGLVQRLGLRSKECFALCLLSTANIELGELTAAHEAALLASAIADETQNVRHQGQTEMLLGRIASARGEYGEATRRLDAALQHFETSPGYRVHSLGMLALNQSVQGDAEGACALAGQALALARQLGHGGVGVSKISLVLVEALLALGRRDEAARSAREAAQALLARAKGIADPWIRERFLQDVAFHARLLALDRELSG